MILTIDIGNTNITCALFYNDKIQYKTSIASKNVENNRKNKNNNKKNLN